MKVWNKAQGTMCPCNLKCSGFILVLLLLVQESSAKLKTTDVDNSPTAKRFKDVLTEAKKAAIDGYLDSVLGSQKRTLEEKRDSLNKLREDFELLMYARRLETLFRKRCTEWWCFGDKATSPTPSTTTTTTPPETTETTTTTPPTTTTTTTPAPVIIKPEIPIHHVPVWPPWSNGGWGAGWFKRKRRWGHLRRSYH